MTLTRGFFSFLCTATMVVFNCEADHGLPAPRELSYEWIDPFTVNVTWSWKKPDDLPDSCEIGYELHLINTKATHRGGQTKVVRTKWRHFADSYLTEETGCSRWETDIQALGIQSCHGWNKSNRESITINTKKPRAEVVKDFKCFIESNGTNCSWSPVNPSLIPTLSYRYCGNSEEDIKSLKRCDRAYSSGIRNGCYLKADPRNRDICVLVETDAGLKTFKPKLVIPLPELRIKEDGDNLNLTWTPPDVGKSCGWEYRVCYKECNKRQHCQTFKRTKETKEHGPMQIPYNKNCLYEFEFNVTTNRYCTAVLSNGRGVGTYGTNNPDRKLFPVTVVATVVSIVLSICVVLSCYCVRRHSAIFCPTIPDPSAIFKEMMMNGNKELKTTTGSLYMPVPEPIEPCKITLATENSVLQQNS